MPTKEELQNDPIALELDQYFRGEKDIFELTPEARRLVKEPTKVLDDKRSQRYIHYAFAIGILCFDLFILACAYSVFTDGLTC